MRMRRKKNQSQHRNVQRLFSNYEKKRVVRILHHPHCEMKCLCVFSHTHIVWKLKAIFATANAYAHMQTVCHWIHRHRAVPFADATRCSRTGCIQINFDQNPSICTKCIELLIWCNFWINPFSSSRHSDWLAQPYVCKSAIAPLVVCRHAEFKFVSTSCRWNVNSNNNNNTVKFLTHSQFSACLCHSHTTQEERKKTTQTQASYSLFLSRLEVFACLCVDSFAPVCEFANVCTV